MKKSILTWIAIVAVTVLTARALAPNLFGSKQTSKPQQSQVAILKDSTLEVAKKDFAKVTAHYAAIANLRIVAEYRLFQNATTTIPYESKRIISEKSADSYAYRLGELEQLANPKVSILIDHEDKMLLLNKTYRPISAVMLDFEIDSALLNCTAVLSWKQDSLQVYAFDTDFPDVSKIEVSFNRSSLLLEKITLYYREEKPLEEGLPAEKPRLEICYLQQEMHATFKPGVFSEHRFVQQQPDSSYALLPKYKAYQLIDYTR